MQPAGLGSQKKFTKLKTMKNKKLKLAVLIVLATIFFGCKKEETNTDPPYSIPALEGLIKLKEGYAIGASAKVEIWAKRDFFTGYNKLTVVLYDSINPSNLIPSAQISFLPEMAMITGAHSCPVENPAEQAIGDVYPGVVIFQMPTVTDGTWQLKLQVHNNSNNKDGLAIFDITVSDPASPLVKPFYTLMPDSARIIMALVEPETPTVGINNIEFTIHRKASMMDFPADDSYSIEIDPQMPSMGHGSPNNVNPVNTGNGHYLGKVNFIMTGWWRVNIVMKKGTDIVSQDLYFDITF